MYEINFHTKISSAWFYRPFDRLSSFPVFGQFESTKLSFIWKVLDGKVRNFSPTKISSFAVTEEETKRAEVDAASCNPKLPKHIATWADSNRPAWTDRTENFVRFQGPLAERSDGFLRTCTILFRTSHLASARFRQSFEFRFAKRPLWKTLVGVNNFTVV